MKPLHSLRTWWRSEWQMPQKRISICTSDSVGSRRVIEVEASGDVALAAEWAFVLCMDYLGLLGRYCMQDAVRGLGGAATCRRSDYEQLRFERYPNPANLLPIPVEAYIFVHAAPDSALPWT